MKSTLTVLIITKNSESTLEKTLHSLRDLTSNIVIVDGLSKDKTVNIAKKFNAYILIYEPHNVGMQRKYGLDFIKTEWVLAIDSDEIVSKKLKREILKIIKSKKNRNAAFKIPIQSYYFRKPLNYGGENYEKLVLFKKNNISIKPSIVHEKFELINGRLGKLNHKIDHYSYRNFRQIYTKFTDYAFKMAEIKFKNNEKSSLKKIILYPVHMFYARFIKDKGYKDGFFRIPLDLGFAYMEFLTYLLLAFKKKKK